MSEEQDEQEIARSIRLPRKLWQALEGDAKRCRRSSVKQLEALLAKWYAIDDVDLQFQTLSAEIPTGTERSTALKTSKTQPKKRRRS